MTRLVIEGAYKILSGFDRVKESFDAMRGITLNYVESELFARAALALKYDDPGKPTPANGSQILMPPSYDPSMRCAMRKLLRHHR